MIQGLAKQGIGFWIPWLFVLLAARPARAEAPSYFSQPIFPAEHKHNHASCIIRSAGGQFLAAWYSGSGERKSDDVVIQGAWLVPGHDRWGPRFLMADTPGYPDCNPA